MRARAAGGFTLVELLVSIAIVAVLASIAMPLAELSRQRERESDLRRSLREIRDAIDAWKRASDEGRITRSTDASGYPPSLAALVEGAVDAKSASGAKLYFLRRIPRDPLHADLAQNPAATWGLRSYASPADEPRPGKEVFDVHSLAIGSGLDGRPYREW